jgi:membrane-bound lytic murein transglycosylase D
MYRILLFLIPSLSFATIMDSNKDFNEAMFAEGLKSYGQTSNSKEDINSTLEDILKDPDKLISNTFNVPDRLKPRVLFWANIYANYPISTAVIHDKSDPAIIYDVLDLSYIFNDKRLNTAGQESRFNQLVSDKKKEIRQILKGLADAKNPKNFFAKTNEEKKIKHIVTHNMKKESDIQNAWKNIRVQTGQKDNIVDGLKNSFKYLPIIEDIFKENGLPWELTRLPFVESSFNLKANSKVGAIGIWQIMGDTGKNFMETKPIYDERYSPFKASAVAAALLKENYDSLKSWPLAITAYNHGPAGLKKASKQLRTKDIVTIISGYKGKNFGFASQNFYSEFLAALYITVYYEKIFGHIEKGHPLSFYYVNIEKDIGVKDLSDVSGLSIAELASYNPEFSNKMLKGEIPIKKGRKVKLPPRASYKVEDYFVKLSDKKELEKELNINETEDD